MILSSDLIDNNYTRSKMMWPLLFLFVVSTICEAFGGGYDKVILRDVQVITLYDGRRTTGRRNSPIPQLNYVGKSSLSKYKPSTVQCYNRGFDGQDVQWECKADLDNRVKFDRVEVLCEGFDYPDDPYILKGSCGLEYSLKSIDNGYGFGSSYSKESHFESGTMGLIVMLVVVVGILYCCGWFGGNRTPGAGGAGGGGGGGGLDDPPPPYPGTDRGSGGGGGWFGGWGGGGGGRRPPGYGFKDQSTPHPESSAPGSGPGFWSGMGAGGLLGYLFGSSRSSQYGGYGSGWDWNRPGGYGSRGRSSWFEGGSSSQPGPSWASGGGTTSSSSGFGGTRRR